MMWDVLDLAIYALFLLALTVGGDAVCKTVLGLTQVEPLPQPPAAATPNAAPPPTDPEPRLRAGRMIGRLERLLITLGLVVRSWEVLVAVIALKTVARHNELDKQIAAEYFLIGSLASILWSLFVTTLLIAFDAQFGFNLARTIRSIAGAS